MCLAMGLLGLGCLIMPLFYSKLLVIYPEELLVPGIFRAKTVRRSDITGFRIRSTQGGKFLQLETAGTGAKKNTVNISMLFKPDAALASWFEGIPSLDAVELAASLKDVEGDAELGESPAARRESVRRAGTIARVLNITSFGLGGWLFFYPHPYEWLFLLVAALPWLALWLCWKSKGAFSVDDTGMQTVRADLTASLILPGIALALRALYDVQLVDISGLAVPSLAGLALMLICLVHVAPYYRKKLGKLLLMGSLLSAYPASVIAIANALFDGLPSESYLVEVIRKHSTSGKATTYYLGVPPWGPFSEANDVQVPANFYRQVEVGQAVCVDLHQGAFGLRWYAAVPRELCRYAQ